MYKCFLFNFISFEQELGKWLVLQCPVSSTSRSDNLYVRYRRGEIYGLDLCVANMAVITTLITNRIYPVTAY